MGSLALATRRLLLLALCLLSTPGCGDVPSTLGRNSDPAADAEPLIDDSGRPHKVVFVSSSVQNGDLGGLEGADQLCAERAASAGLAGNFRAWLSSPDQSAEERLDHAAIPYARTDGTRVADDWDDLVDGQLRAPIDRDEDGTSADGDAWTGTLASGDDADLTCGGFASTDDSGVCGSVAASDGSWTDAVRPPCSAALRIYCFEQ